MEHKNLNKIKSFEGPPKKVNIFSEREIEMIRELYYKLPERVYNKKQNIRKKVWEQNYNKELDKLYFNKLNEFLGDFKMDNLKSDDGQEYYGLFHESFTPLPIHVDSGFYEDDIIYKQVVTPLTPVGDTIFFKKRWYGRSTTFTIDPEELKFKPQPDQNDRSNKHLGSSKFDKNLHSKYLSHIDINNLQGMEMEFIYDWKVGESLIVDRSHIHCASTRIVDKKLGLTTFTKK